MNSKKFLITGFSGFVGRHFLQYLYERPETFEVCGIDIKEPAFDCSIYADKINIRFKKVNLLNSDELKNVLTEFVPDYILHLASFSSVAYSWQHPEDCFVNNTNIFLNLTSSSLPVSKEMLSDYLTHIHKQYKPKSVKRKIASIKAFFIIWNMKRLLQKIPLTSFVFSSGSRFVFQRPFLYIS